MIYYFFDPTTNEYLGSRTPQIDPLESEIQGTKVYTLPGQQETKIAPPNPIEGFATIWKDGGWTTIENHRGETWYDGNTPITIDELGVPPYSRTPPPPDTDTLRKQKLGELSSKFYTAVESDYIAVTSTAGKFNYGIDDSTRQNLQMTLLGVVSGIIKASREWTPKGRLDPITITPDDIVLIAGTVGNAYDTYVKEYLTKKAVIMRCTTDQEIVDYDVTINWPKLEK